MGWRVGNGGGVLVGADGIEDKGVEVGICRKVGVTVVLGIALQAEAKKRRALKRNFIAKIIVRDAVCPCFYSVLNF